MLSSLAAAEMEKTGVSLLMIIPNFTINRIYFLTFININYFASTRIEISLQKLSEKIFFLSK
jgi:hypothetical protein